MTMQLTTARELLTQHRHRVAVATLARYRAKEKVKQWIRPQGYRLQEFSAKQLAIMAEAYLVDHQEELIAEAKVEAEEFLTK